MKKLKTALLSLLLGIVCVFIALGPAAGSAWAAQGSSDAIIMEKTLANAIRVCYSSNNVRTEVLGSEFLRNGYKAVFKGSSNTIKMPGSESISCAQVFEQLGSGKNNISLTNLGFVQEGDSAERRCLNFSYSADDANHVRHPYVSNEACFSVRDGKIEGYAPTYISNGNGPASISNSVTDNNAIWVGDNRQGSNITYAGVTWDKFIENFGTTLNNLDRRTDFKEGQVKLTTTTEDSSRNKYVLRTSGSSNPAETALNFYMGAFDFNKFKFNQSDIYQIWEYDLMRMKDAGLVSIEDTCYPTKNEATSRFSDHGYAYYKDSENMWCAIKYNDKSIVPNYHVVNSDYNALVSVEPKWILDHLTKRDAGNITDAMAQAAKKQSCNEGAESYKAKAESLLRDSHTYEDLRKRAERILEVLNSISTYWEEDQDGNIICRTIVDFYGNIVPLDGELAEPDYTNPDAGNNGSNGSPEDGNGPEGNGEVDCGSEVNGLGWILCPTLNILGNTVSDIYDGYIRSNFLEVKPEWLNTESEVYTKGWSQFRNFANILFAILLVIVILSQVTGIGITNYGIKKMLPRLIVVAVLINLSFFICQLAVDISNILGVSLEQILSDMGVAVEMPTGGGAAGSTAGSIASVLSVAGIAAAGFSVGAWIVPVLLGLLSSLIGVLFCAIILGLRQALIVLLVVISPLAIACYALDGTKSFFDKWRKLFVALLAVFPICGILMGAGVFGSSLLWSVATGNFFLQLISVLLKVVPFFLIPSVLKQSFAIAGNIGAKISRIGSGVRGDFTRVARKSDLYQRADATAGAAHAGASNWMGKGLRRIPGVGKIADSKFGQFLGRGGTRRRAQFIQKQYNLATSDATANAIAAGGLLDSERRAGIESSALEKAESQGTEEQQSLYRTKLGIDGVANESTLKRELEAVQREYDNKPFDATLRRKVKALTKFMLDFDNGRGVLAQMFHNQISQSPNSATTRAMDEFLQRPENMGVIKQSGQRGLQAMLMDRAQKKPIQSLSQYAFAKADKPTANAVGNMDTSALTAQVQAIINNPNLAKNTDKASQEAMSALAEWANVYTEAMSNKNTSGNLSAEQKRLMQDVRNYVSSKGDVVPVLNVPH